MPHIDELLDQLGTAAIYSTLDLAVLADSYLQKYLKRFVTHFDSLLADLISTLFYQARLSQCL